jgi:hypothetical protein
MSKLKDDEKKRWQDLKAELDRFGHLHPGQLPLGSAMTDIGDSAPKTYLLAKGVFNQPREEIPPGFLQILDSHPAQIIPPSNLKSTGRRTAFANLLTAPDNPLTARVMANRIWHYHFGQGIVGTTSDFGLKGDRPTHPALLDWLANEFIQSGWSMKQLHRLIMTSSTYQQSSKRRLEAAKIDPQNKLLWRFPLYRLEGEVIRDSALAVAGLLNSKMGGPSVFPELPPGMPTPRGGWKVNEELAERNRRSVYVFVRRNTRYPLFESFDMPDPHESCSRRNVTTSPIQALNLLNSKMSLEWAQSFAARVLGSAGGDRDKQIETAFRLAYCRLPDKAEKEIAQRFFESQREILAERAARGGELALPPALPEKVQPVEGATLVDLCHMLINSNEFVYRN